VTLTTIRKPAAALAALAALALGGAALAGAADSPSKSSSSANAARSERQPLASEDAAKVKAAAVERVPGATVLRS
jgi:hypothetical protein